MQWPKMTTGGKLAQVVTPVENRIDQMLRHQTVRNVLNQAEGGLDLSDVVSSGKILLVNIPQGPLGVGVSSFLGAVLISKLQSVAMRDIHAAQKRPPLFLYIDEFQNFVTNAFDKIVTEVRAFRVGLIVANQFTQQLERSLQLALDNSIGFRVTCMEKSDQQKYWLCYQRLSGTQYYTPPKERMPYECEGTELVPFPPATGGDPKMPDRIRRRSRNKYAKRWTGPKPKRQPEAPTDQDDPYDPDDLVEVD
jgi:hypothetical protein